MRTLALTFRSFTVYGLSLIERRSYCRPNLTYRWWRCECDHRGLRASIARPIIGSLCLKRYDRASNNASMRKPNRGFTMIELLVVMGIVAILVLIEKVLPLGQWVGRAVGVALIGWGVATLVI